MESHNNNQGDFYLNENLSDEEQSYINDFNLQYLDTIGGGEFQYYTVNNNNNIENSQQVEVRAYNACGSNDAFNAYNEYETFVDDLENYDIAEFEENSKACLDYLSEIEAGSLQVASQLQFGGGDGDGESDTNQNAGEFTDSFKYIEIVTDRKRNLRFRQCYKKTSSRFRFINVSSEREFEEAIEEIAAYIRHYFNDADMVGLRFRLSNDATDNGVYVSPRRVDQIHAAVITEQYENVMQSNHSFHSYGDVFIDVDQIYLPHGGGTIRMNKPTNSPVQYKLLKKSIMFSSPFMEPGEINCLFISIALGVIRLNDSIKIPKGRTALNYKNWFRDIVRKEATRIACKAGISFTNIESLPSIPEFEKVQKVLNCYSLHHDESESKKSNSTYRVIIYDRSGEVIFRGLTERSDVEIQNINLLLDQQHFDVIISLTGCFSFGYFCEACCKGFSERSRHKNCIFTCDRCFKNPPCSQSTAEPQALQSCLSCLRMFYNDSCFKSHRESSVCKTFRICKICNRGKQKDHICGFYHCRECEAIRPYQHTCFIPVYTSPVPKTKIKHLYVFYDFEAMMESRSDNSGNDHIINLCVSNTVCDTCLAIPDDDYTCDTCGIREQIFRFKSDDDNSVTDAFLEYLSTLALKHRLTVIAHNGSKYDSVFLARRVFEKYSYSKPTVVLAGKKIYSLKFGNIRIIDSLNFVQAPLSKIPKMFNFPIDDRKGIFPHSFNIKKHQNYVGPMPDRSFYEPESMKDDELREFDTWYSMNCNNKFDFQREIEKYCIQDTRLLRKFCLILRNETFSDSGIEIFREALTLPAYVNKVFRKKFYKPNSIALVPRNGYRMSDVQSTMGLIYLRYMELQYNASIQSAFNGFEKLLWIGGKYYKVDGYLERTIKDSAGNEKIEKIVFEFHGCYYHFHTCMSNGLVEVDTEDQTTIDRILRRDATMRKTADLRSAGYCVVEAYECEFKKILQSNPDLLTLRDDIKMEPLDVRHSFYGGKTETISSYRKANSNEKIVYFDVCSLYPFINKFGKFPISRPTIIVGDRDCRKVDIDTFEGFIKCRILAPRKLYHPVLPIKMHNKLLFILCYKCAEECNQGLCTHSDEERSWIGTFVIDELRKGLESGYQIITIYEMWKYEVSIGLFSNFITHYQSEKLYSSGLPPGINDSNIGEYIASYEAREGLKLDPTKFKKNPAKRAFSKLILNSFWGKFSQREHATTAIITEAENLFKIINNPRFIIKGMVPICETVLIVNYEDLDAQPLNTTSIPIAAYTTAQARLKLNELLSQAQRAALYVDTDSIIAVQSLSEPSLFQSGIFLGDLTDELEAYGEGSYITEFVCLGPKSYSFLILNPTTGVVSEVTKVKGITLNSKNKTIINFESMKKQILDEQSSALNVKDTFFVRTNDLKIYTTKRTKIFRPVLTKRRMVGEKSFPYGYDTDEIETEWKC